MRSCASVDSATDGRSQTGANMLETYFSASKMLGHLRSGPSGPYLDGFAATLERQGYSAGTAVRYLRAAAHLGHVVVRQCPLSSDDMAEVCCRPQISHGCVGAIALPLKRRCETVKVWSAWPAPQVNQQLRCREVGLQHVRPHL